MNNPPSQRVRELSEKILKLGAMPQSYNLHQLIQQAFDEELAAKDARIAELEASGKRLYEALFVIKQAYGNTCGIQHALAAWEATHPC